MDDEIYKELNKLEKAVMMQQARIDVVDARLDRLASIIESNVSMQDHNTKALGEVSDSLKVLSEETHGLVEAWNAVKGTVRVAQALRAVLLWGAGVSGVVYAVYDYIKFKL